MEFVRSAPTRFRDPTGMDVFGAVAGAVGDAVDAVAEVVADGAEVVAGVVVDGAEVAGEGALFVGKQTLKAPVNVLGGVVWVAGAVGGASGGGGSDPQDPPPPEHGGGTPTESESGDGQPESENGNPATPGEEQDTEGQVEQYGNWLVGFLGLSGLCLGDFSFYSAEDPGGVDDVTFGHEGAIHPDQWDTWGILVGPFLAIDNVVGYDSEEGGATGAEPSNSEARAAADSQKSTNTGQ
jgi:hypothetical protein